MSTVSIMPGMENLAPLRQETSNGRAGSPKTLPLVFSTAFKAFSSWSHMPSGKMLPGFEIGIAGLGGDGKPRGHGHADAGHLGQVGALAAQEPANRFPVTAGLGLYFFHLVKPIDPFCHFRPLSQ